MISQYVVFVIKDLSELFNILKNFYSNFSAHSETIRILRSDNEKKYFSNRFNSFMHSKGVIHQSSCPYTPQQNDVAERKHRQFVDTSRTLLINVNVPLKFWGNVVLTVRYLINRIPSDIYPLLVGPRLLNRSGCISELGQCLTIGSVRNNNITYTTAYQVINKNLIFHIQ